MDCINGKSGKKRHYPFEVEEKNPGESRMPCKDTSVGIRQSCKPFPEDVIVEILSRLPVKSLIRFKCVCKSMHRLILSPLFMKIHRNKSKDKVGLLIDYYDPAAGDRLFQTSSVFFNYPLDFRPMMDANIAGCSNGLVCFVVPFMQYCVVCNPATRDFVYLPARTSAKRKDARFICFQSGFAFIPSVNDYKLVIHSFYDNKLSVMELFTWSSNSWKTIEAILPFEINYFADYSFRSRCVVNGFMHWLGAGFEGSKYLVYFDIGKEKFGKVMLPGSSEYNLRMKSKTLAVLKQSLAMFAFQGPSNLEFDIWILNAYDGAEELWMKLCTIGPLTGYFRPLGFWINDDIILSKYAMGNFDPVLYHRNTNEVKDLQLGPLYINCFVPYSESLFPVKHCCVVNS